MERQVVDGILGGMDTSRYVAVGCVVAVLWGAAGCAAAAGREFTVAPDGRAAITATAFWKKQSNPQLIAGANASFNDTAIAICVIGDFSSSSARPGRGQFSGVVDLVRALQFAFRVSPGHVYLHSDLDAYSRLPGRGFPAADFNSALLRIRP